MIVAPTDVSVFRFSKREVFIAWRKSVDVVDFYRIYKRMSPVGIDKLIGSTVGEVPFFYDLCFQKLRVYAYYSIEAVRGEEVSSRTFVVSEEDMLGIGLAMTFEQFVGLYDAEILLGPPKQVIEEPGGIKDGVNKTYTLSYVSIPGSLKVNLGGATYLLSGTDFIEGRDSFSFIDLAPLPTDVLRVEYLRTVEI